MDASVWVKMIVGYLKEWQSYHPYKSTVRVMISEGWLAEIYHYHPGPFYFCTMFEYIEMKPVFCGIITL